MYLANFDSNLGTLLYSTALGTLRDGSQGDFVIDEVNRLIYIAGQGTPATTANAVRRTPAGIEHYLVLLDRGTPGRTSLRYSTLLGGSGHEFSFDDLSVDANGVATLTGTTLSADFPVTNGSFQTARSGSRAGYIARIDPSAAGAAGLVYSSYFGGSGSETRLRHEADPGGHLHLLAISSSPDLPATPNALLGAAAGQNDAFYAQFDPALPGAAAVTYGSWIVAGASGEGVNPDNAGVSTALGSGTLAMLVETSSTSVGPPGPAGGFQPQGSAFRGYVVLLDLTGPAPTIDYSSHYRGCPSSLFSHDIAFHPSGDLLLAGTGDAPVTPGAFQLVNAGLADGFVGRLEPAPWPSGFRTLGISCATSAGTPTLRGVVEARICGSLRVEATGLPARLQGLMFLGSTTSWLSTPLPVALPGAPGCALHVAPEVLVNLRTGTGTATFTLRIPTAPRLVGSELGIQYAVLDPGANPLGLATTNGLAVEVRW